MAGDWIKMEVSTPDKPEVFAICAAMGWDDPDVVVGKLFRVWRWFDQHTTNGNAPGVTLALLDRISGVTGFGAAMQSVGWLIVDDAGIRLPGFEKHCGKTAKERAQTAKRVANYKSNGNGNGGSVTSSVTEALPREDIDLDTNKNLLSPSTTATENVTKLQTAIPYQEILDLYHSALPELPRVRIFDDKRKASIRRWWKQNPNFQTLDFWTKFYAAVRRSSLLMGDVKRHDGSTWQADFDWLLTDKGFKTVVEGKREDRCA